MNKTIFKLVFFLTCLTLQSQTVVAASAPAPIINNADVLHRHVGGSSGGGCYGTPNICGGRIETRTENPHGCGISASGGGCSHCGCYYEPPSAMYPSGCAHCNCPKPTVTSCTRCGRGGGGGTCSAITSYSLSCGQSTNTILGQLTLAASTIEWTDKLVITATVNNIGLSLQDDAYIWNAGAATSSNTIEITENKEYTCGLNVRDTNTSNATSALAKISVGNIDDIVPIIDSLTPDTTEWVNKKIMVTVSAHDGEMGLHGTSYSYDGGVTWVAENTYEYFDNGIHTVWVKDKAENKIQAQIEIKNIDKAAPNIDSILYEDTPDIINTTLTVTATDLQADGSTGSGLDDVAYSYDGGATWVAENTKLITLNGDYRVCVKDKMQNVASQIVSIRNIDSTSPNIVEMTQESESWTNKDVTIFVNAIDSGSGIEAYSWDGGVTWSADALSTVVSSNGSYKVMVRDRCGNTSEGQKDIINIDRIQPHLSWNLSPEVKSWYKDSATLSIQATDDLSGVYLYSFNGGGTWIKESAIKITDNTTISLQVRDCAGNIAATTIALEKQLLPVLPTIVKPPKKEELNKAVEILKKEEIQVPMQEFPMPKNPIIKHPKKNVPNIIIKSEVRKVSLLPIVTGTATGTVALTLIIINFFPLVPIYALKTNGKYKLIGAAIAKKKKENYYLNVKGHQTKKAETNNFKIKLGRFFAFAHKNKDFVIRIEHKEIMKKVERELCF